MAVDPTTFDDAIVGKLFIAEGQGDYQAMADILTPLANSSGDYGRNDSKRIDNLLSIWSMASAISRGQMQEVNWGKRKIKEILNLIAFGEAEPATIYDDKYDIVERRVRQEKLKNETPRDERGRLKWTKQAWVKDESPYDYHDTNNMPENADGYYIPGFWPAVLVELKRPDESFFYCPYSAMEHMEAAEALLYDLHERGVLTEEDIWPILESEAYGRGVYNPDTHQLAILSGWASPEEWVEAARKDDTKIVEIGDIKLSDDMTRDSLTGYDFVPLRKTAAWILPNYYPISYNPDTQWVILSEDIDDTHPHWDINEQPGDYIDDYWRGLWGPDTKDLIHVTTGPEFQSLFNGRKDTKEITPVWEANYTDFDVLKEAWEYAAKLDTHSVGSYDSYTMSDEIEDPDAPIGPIRSFGWVLEVAEEDGDWTDAPAGGGGPEVPVHVFRSADEIRQYQENHRTSHWTGEQYYALSWHPIEKVLLMAESSGRDDTHVHYRQSVLNDVYDDSWWRGLYSNGMVVHLTSPEDEMSGKVYGEMILYQEYDPNLFPKYKAEWMEAVKHAPLLWNGKPATEGEPLEVKSFGVMLGEPPDDEVQDYTIFEDPYVIFMEGDEQAIFEDKTAGVVYDQPYENSGYYVKGFYPAVLIKRDARLPDGGYAAEAVGVQVNISDNSGHYDTYSTWMRDNASILDQDLEYKDGKAYYDYIRGLYNPDNKKLILMEDRDWHWIDDFLKYMVFDEGLEVQDVGVREPVYSDDHDYDPSGYATNRFVPKRLPGFEAKISSWIEGFHSALIAPDGKFLWLDYSWGSHTDLLMEEGYPIDNPTYFASWRGMYNPKTETLVHITNPDELKTFGLFPSDEQIESLPDYSWLWLERAEQAGVPVKRFGRACKVQLKNNGAPENVKKFMEGYDDLITYKITWPQPSSFQQGLDSIKKHLDDAEKTSALYEEGDGYYIPGFYPAILVYDTRDNSPVAFTTEISDAFQHEDVMIKWADYNIDGAYWNSPYEYVRAVYDPTSKTLAIMNNSAYLRWGPVFKQFAEQAGYPIENIGVARRPDNPNAEEWASYTFEKKATQVSS